jgi:hypothetical protein
VVGELTDLDSWALQQNVVFSGEGVENLVTGK